MTADKKKIVKTAQQWSQQLDDKSYYVTREKGTEHAFSGEYNDCTTSGQYRCICCDEVLFDSASKFDAGCGWPSFTQPVDDTVIEEHKDISHFMVRTEVVCQRCDAHLGHVFNDGPNPTGLRYCINSVALKLEAKDPE